LQFLLVRRVRGKRDRRSASLGFHTAHFDTAYTFGLKVTNYWATADMLAYYPQKVKEWISRRGGLTTDMKTMESGPELWAIVAPCPVQPGKTDS
jgi:hypothetical protein